MSAGRKRRAAIEDADVVQTEEAALEDVHPLGVLAIHPPREVDQQLVEDALEELTIADAAATLLDLVDAPARPTRAPADSRRRAPTRTPAAARSGCMYHSRSSRISWSLANSESTSASATQWNARSHAAYHGYSHLSGIEMTSEL